MYEKIEGNNVVSRGIRKVYLAMIVALVIMLISNICMPIYAYNDNDDMELFILMYHNVVPTSSGCRKYEIEASKLEEDLRRIATLHLNVVTPSDLMLYRAGKKNIHGKCVMLTFDDGYYSYIKYLVPLLKKYNMKALVNVVGEYTAYNKNNPKTAPRYTYLDYEDIEALRDSGVIEIGLHSYKMHHIKGGVQGVAQRKGESDSDYRLRLLGDTNRLIKALASHDIYSKVYAYPYGAYSRCSDSVLIEVGIEMTLSCNEGINHLNRDSSLFLLKRYNRDGDKGRLEDIFPFFR